MSVREEDKQKGKCTSRAVGLAVGALGVGVGAALYYYFSKRPEHPDGEGSTSGWNCERAQALQSAKDQDDSYTTISENDTSDTSMHSSITLESNPSLEDESNEEWQSSIDMEANQSLDDEISSEEWPSFSAESDTDNTTDNSDSEAGEYNVDILMDEYEQRILTGLPNTSGDSDMIEWDVSSSSIRDPGGSVASSMLYSNFQDLYSPTVVSDTRMEEEEQRRIMRQQAYRERSWSLEECSICFDVMLKDQQLTTLPCTHHFHSACITPWLNEQQTCPNCRKAAE